MTKRPTPAQKLAPPSDLPWTRELRSAIADDERSPYALAVDAGVDQAAVRRFISRERSLSLESAEKLGTVLGLQLVRKVRKRTKA